ncbi:hypothetical protein [Planobispora longispora]|uniref:Septum formation initiator n=1 Tax=Planobispora longispora TaxID=28887 RepID=A0A8J3W4S2_9ACTN|nr:hypothetical protein [Planobispora longispora]BFE84426.1 hypothetical protein GCM10020093_070270 [Planobispora longispora]GIH75693.1 hypothetical protein Plo01_21220 [Planobispora longispora]
MRTHRGFSGRRERGAPAGERTPPTGDGAPVGRRTLLAAGDAPVGRRALLAAGGWLTAAVLTTLAGIWAVSLIGGDIAGQAVRSMTPEEVERILATASAAPVAAPPSAATPYGAAGNFSYAEGSVTAACDADRALLLSWTPAPGYGVDEVERGPAATASVVFESDDRTAVISLVCRAGTPSAAIRSVTEPDED